jgi:hypothetical protein
VTRGTRPKKPSSSRGFAREARGVRGFRGLKTENRKPKTENCKFFLSFQAGNNYQKNYYYYYFIFSRPRGCDFYHVRR